MRSPPKVQVVKGRPVPSLPVELLDQIFSLCSPKTLKQLNLASKRFLDISQPLLFANVVVMCGWQFKDLDNLTQHSERLAGLVRSLEIGFPTES
ncbi:hypothetical protein BDY24DRAFT_400335 [Mrakia frigida]|uniref:F-box protein n=1 Tax=Mrakia frigida TaxID=29902 RepID=UPI003FCBF09A